MLDHQGPVGLGVDGSASNDASNLMSEARAALLMARARELDAAAMTAREALEMATVGGARVLGRDDIGCLAPGMSADFVAIDIDRPELAGAHHDLVAAMLLCQVSSVDYSFVNGRRIVHQGRLTTIDLEALVRKHNQLAHRLVHG
jgi:cytosine/adenosine deaminase-related metal-dependent hydrolase